MRPDELERRLQERLDALGSAPRAELLHVLMLPDFDRADWIGSYFGNPATRTFAELLRCLLLPDYERAGTIGEAISRTEILAAYRRGCGQAALGARVKAVLALGIIAVLGFLGFQVADPLYDAAARTICSNYAEDEGLVLAEARGMPTGRLAFRSFPDYSCRFRDSAGSAVFVDENDRLIEPTWTYRALRAAGWLAWIVGIVAGVGISAAFGLMKRD